MYKFTYKTVKRTSRKSKLFLRIIVWIDYMQIQR